MIVQAAISFLFGIIFGMIPFCYILGQIKGIDLRKIGSGNIGATNLSRACGFHFFIIGFILDGLKGLIPVLLVRTFALPAAFAGAGAIIGHIFNPFFGFQGGKGVSTTIGVAAGLVPKSFAISLIVWLVVYLTSLIVAIGSIAFAAVLPIVAFLLGEAALTDRIFILIMGILIIVAHRSNIKRIINRKEPKTKIWRQ